VQRSGSLRRLYDMEAEAEATALSGLAPRSRRPRRGRWLAPAAAALAVAAVVGVLAGVRIADGRPPAPAGAPGGRPAFYVALPPPGYPGRPAATIHATVGGRVTGRAVVHGQTLGQVAAAADDRTFVLSAYHRKPDGAVRPDSVISFYRLRLTGDGRVASLRRLPLTVPTGPSGYYQVTALALSGDGGTLAVAEGAGSTGPGRLVAVSLRTGRARTWTVSDNDQIGGLSWGHGATFGVLIEAEIPLPGEPDVFEAGYRLRLLDTSRPVGDLLTASTLVPLSTDLVESAVLINHGREVAAWTRTGLTARLAGNAVLSVFSVTTGRPLELLYAVPGNGQFPGHGTVWSADPSGRHLLVGLTTPTEVPPQAGPFLLGHTVFGRLDRGQLTPLPVIQPKEPPQPAAW
jgi:hypothetical protein